MDNYAGMPVKIESFGSKVAVLPIGQVEKIIESSGFEAPVHFFQTLLIHSWFSKLSVGDYSSDVGIFIGLAPVYATILVFR